MKIKKELYKAQKYDIVSFDIFDTLIERNVEKPTDIFFQVGVGCFLIMKWQWIFKSVEL